MIKEIIERLNTLEAENLKFKELINSLNSKTSKLSKEERFWEIMLKTNSIKIDKDKYPNSTFGFVDDKFYWEFDSKISNLMLSHTNVWSIFERDFALKYIDIQSFIKNEVEEHFKCKGITPHLSLRIRTPRVEEHFKCMGITPDSASLHRQYGVEDHFKCKAITPIFPLDVQ